MNVRVGDERMQDGHTDDDALVDVPPTPDGRPIGHEMLGRFEERGTMKPLGRLALSWKLSLAVHKRQPSVQWHLSVSSSQSDGALKNCIP